MDAVEFVDEFLKLAASRPIRRFWSISLVEDKPGHSVRKWTTLTFATEENVRNISDNLHKGWLLANPDRCAHMVIVRA